jgi:AAA domain
VPAEHATALVDLLVDEVLDRRCVALAAPHDGIEEPEVLRRVDGSSVYTVAGADLYTSQRILDAEARLVAAAGRRGGASVEQAAVDLALLEMAANGTALGAGQASLVRQMCTSGARLQLAIAPAGAGKTTAMRALALAWTQDGGQVVGLAPSAAAAAVLAEQTGIRSDTLAKLTWSLEHGQLPYWAAVVGPSTMVIIDEAGMADTLSLDTAVQFVVARGGSVRLVGDDQQLAAIGAGGILRDIKTQHGAVQLTELHRFTDPAEAHATLALRDGDPKSLDFYLSNGRVQVGDLAATTEDAFTAWAADRAAGLDAIMLAPTRDLVAELNRRARNHRLSGDIPNAVVRLADGNQASAGDVIITRSNDRRLRLTATDWVKNGDRWTITGIGQKGELRVRHNRSRLNVRLPADYVQHSTSLGYATTVHAAQGVSSDTMHGLLSGEESRQQLYTMLTRGRTANPSRRDRAAPHQRAVLADPAGTCSPWRPRPVSTHSSTFTQRPPVANSTPQQTWPACWTGASQNPQPLTRGRSLGFPAFQQHSMIILFGANIWRSGPNSLPTSPTGSEATSAKTKHSLCGCNRAAARTSPSSVKSRCGGPPTASTLATHDQPDQDNCRLLGPLATPPRPKSRPRQRQHRSS